MPQDQAVAQAQKLWEEKKPREAITVLLKRVSELSIFSEDPAVAQAKALWNQKKPNAALLLLVNRINELNAQLAAAWSEPILEEAVPPKKQVHAPVTKPDKKQPNKRAWLLFIVVLVGFAFLGIAIGFASGVFQPLFKQSLPSQVKASIREHEGYMPEVIFYQKAKHPENLAHIEAGWDRTGIYGVDEAWCVAYKLVTLECGDGGMGYKGGHAIIYRQGSKTWDAYNWGGPWYTGETTWRSIGCDWKEHFTKRNDLRCK